MQCKPSGSMQKYRETPQVRCQFAPLGDRGSDRARLGDTTTDAAATFRQKRNLSPYGFESVPNAWSLDRDISIQQHAARTQRITGSKRPVVNGGMLPS